MVHSCAAYNCKRRWQKEVKLKFHRIPIKDIELRKSWLQALKRKDYNPKCGYICEKHFLETDYVLNVHGNKELKKKSVPSVFDSPVDLKKTEKQRILTRIITNEISLEIDHRKMANENFVESYPEISDKPLDLPHVPGKESQILLALNSSNERKRNKRDPVFFGDFEESDLNCRVKRARFWKVAHETVDKHRKLSKYYQCQIRRQKNKIRSLNELLNELKEKQKITSSQL